MKFLKIGKYNLVIWDTGNITCECIYGSLYPLNYLEGKTICKHIKKYIKSNGKNKVAV